MGVFSQNFPRTTGISSALGKGKGSFREQTTVGGKEMARASEKKNYARLLYKCVSHLWVRVGWVDKTE